MSVPNSIHEAYISNEEQELPIQHTHDAPVMEMPKSLEELVGPTTLDERTWEFIRYQPTWKHRFAQAYGALLAASIKSPWYEADHTSTDAGRLAGYVSDGIELARAGVEAPLYVGDGLIWLFKSVGYVAKSVWDTGYHAVSGLYQLGRHGGPGWESAMVEMKAELLYNLSEIGNFSLLPWHAGGLEGFVGMGDWAEKAQLYPLSAAAGAAVLYGVARWKRHTLTKKAVPELGKEET